MDDLLTYATTRGKDLDLTSGYILAVNRNQQTTQLNNGPTCRIGWTSEACRVTLISTILMKFFQPIHACGLVLVYDNYLLRKFCLLQITKYSLFEGGYYVVWVWPQVKGLFKPIGF
jgi:hypothetical protein